MRLQRGDFALGVAAMLLAGAWLAGASRIPESLLSDAVGAAGLPRAVGWALAAVGLLLCLRSVRFTPAAASGQGKGLQAHLRALGLLAILVGYVLLAPWLGYALATGLLVAAGAAYAGAPRSRWLVLIPLAAALVFWLLFVFAFGIPMPGSPFFGSF